MLVTYLTEDPAADALRKARTDKQTDIDVMKAALRPSNAMIIGGNPGCDVIPFRKAAPRAPQPRPPEREAAKLATSNLRKHLPNGLGELLLRQLRRAR